MTLPEPRELVVCRSTRYGKGCGHPISDHNGTGTCCCCSGSHNDERHIQACPDCSTKHATPTAQAMHCRTRFVDGVTHEPHEWTGLYPHHRYQCPGGLPPAAQGGFADE